MSNKYRFFLNIILGLCIAELNLVIFHIKEFFWEKKIIIHHFSNICHTFFQNTVFLSRKKFIKHKSLTNIHSALIYTLFCAKESGKKKISLKILKTFLEDINVMMIPALYLKEGYFTDAKEEKNIDK